MKVKLKKQTYWKGRALLPGETIDINSEDAERWIKKGIASPTDAALASPARDIAINKDPLPENLSEMTVKALIELATEKGIKYPKNVRKGDLIDLIKPIPNIDAGGTPDKKKE